LKDEQKYLLENKGRGRASENENEMKLTREPTNLKSRPDDFFYLGRQVILPSRRAPSVSS